MNVDEYNFAGERQVPNGSVVICRFYDERTEICCNLFIVNYLEPHHNLIKHILHDEYLIILIMPHQRCHCTMNAQMRSGSMFAVFSPCLIKLLLYPVFGNRVIAPGIVCRHKLIYAVVDVSLITEAVTDWFQFPFLLEYY